MTSVGLQKSTLTALPKFGQTYSSWESVPNKTLHLKQIHQTGNPSRDSMPCMQGALPVAAAPAAAAFEPELPLGRHSAHNTPRDGAMDVAAPRRETLWFPGGCGARPVEYLRRFVNTSPALVRNTQKRNESPPSCGHNHVTIPG
jgi:hypothetical protein